MSEHRYSLAALLPDYVRAATGFFGMGALFLLTDLSPVMLYIVAGLAAVFALFGVAAVKRHLTSFALGEQAMQVRGPGGGRLEWSKVRAVSLRYYSTRRDRSQGWMQLVVAGERRRFRADSTISDFALLVRRVLMAAEALGLPLSPATRANARELGIRLGS